ncbi:hypothetical protein ISF_09890 [Cordyceps fumosorosea ARSEF 2679]|uniref:Uncharacterized protein n=1 Tax=Cordyceps fumosorosea (strain ARSEF 2679) TaxID=1081104 RepID=A0A166ZZ80_CORFA|nr:hypothetical protein ISF_09890 [Cordyceps fumosorosea ARSEF 2679]OAA38392.1 hypothetical protein ISF_09890 [Cordyceps fumosorosea ARSEF 2679]
MSNPDDWPEEAKNEISRLEFDNDALQQEVGRSVAKIISLQGEDDQITDGDLKRRFEEICANIEDWTTAIEVEFLQQGREFRQVFHQILDDDPGRRFLYRWGLLEPLHDSAQEIGKLYWLGQLDTCIKVVLSRVIWQSLYAEVFVKTYPPGTRDDAANGLHYITDAIRHGADGRLNEESVFQANKWRSSAFSSLATTKWFRSTRKTQLAKILNSLRDTLSRPPLSMDESTFRKNAVKLEDDIILAAATLKQEMACSTLEYTILDPRDWLSPQTQLYESTLKDIDGWRVVNQSQSVGGIFLCLFPGVYKRAAKDGELSPLVKPVLITYHQDAAKSLQAFQSQAALSTLKQQRRKSESNLYLHRSDGKPGEEAVRSVRRSKQSERAGGSSSVLANFLPNSMKNIRSRQPEDGSRSNARSPIDSQSGGRALEDKTKQRKAQGPTQSGEKRAHKKSSRQAASATSSTATSADSQKRSLASMRREDSGRNSTSDVDVMPKNIAAQDVPATVARGTWPPQRSDSKEESGEDHSNLDDASSTDTTSARCRLPGSPHDLRIDVDVEGRPAASYTLQTALSGRGSASIAYSEWDDPYYTPRITRD